jgi:methyl-accepting chemotaxis protein
MKLSSNSLVFKIIFFGVILVFISLLTFSSIFLISQHKKLSEQIVDKGLIFAEFSAKPIYNDYVNFYTQSSNTGFSTFKERTEDKMKRNEDVIYLSLVSRNGRILFNSKDLEKGEYYTGNVRNISDPKTLEMLKSTEIDYREIEYEGERAIEIVMPIEELSGDHVFSMRYIVSFESFSQQMFVMYRDIGISFLIVFILVTLISIPFYSNITKPINKLTNLTKKIREGDLAVKADFVNSGSDEIGELAENFNVMVDELRQSKEKGVEEQKRVEEELKRRVKEIQDEKERLKEENKEIGDKLSKLEIKNKELEKTNKFMVDRELKMVELKKKLKGEDINEDNKKDK